MAAPDKRTHDGAFPEDVTEKSNKSVDDRRVRSSAMSVEQSCNVFRLPQTDGCCVLHPNHSIKYFWDSGPAEKNELESDENVDDVELIESNEKKEFRRVRNEESKTESDEGEDESCGILGPTTSMEELCSVFPVMQPDEFRALDPIYHPAKSFYEMTHDDVSKTEFNEIPKEPRHIICTHFEDSRTRKLATVSSSTITLKVWLRLQAIPWFLQNVGAFVKDISRVHILELWIEMPSWGYEPQSIDWAAVTVAFPHVRALSLVGLDAQYLITEVEPSSPFSKGIEKLVLDDCCLSTSQAKHLFATFNPHQLALRDFQPENGDWTLALRSVMAVLRWEGEHAVRLQEFGIAFERPRALPFRPWLNGANWIDKRRWQLSDPCLESVLVHLICDVQRERSQRLAALKNGQAVCGTTRAEMGRNWSEGLAYEERVFEVGLEKRK